MTAPGDKTLVLVDGSALAFRSFYALMKAGMRKADGTPTGAVLGFFRSLFDLLEEKKPDMMAVCFDMKEPTFRHLEYEPYKANRLEMPDELSVQWPIIKRGLKALAVPIYEMAGFEADDIIGTVAKQAGKRGYKVLILTGDQDAFQLLDGYIQVLMPGHDGLAHYGRDEVFKKLAVWPEQIIDYKALCGDASDNIPGVKGIGPKTASALLADFKTLDSIYASLDKIKSATTQKKLKDGHDSAFASQRLATIKLDVPIQFDFQHCALSLPDVETVAGFFRELEFTSILKRLPRALSPFNQGIEPQIDEPHAASGSGQLAIPSLTVANNVPEPEIVRTEDEFKLLLSELGKQSIVSFDLETTSVSSLNCRIVGYALAWSNSASLTGDGQVQFSGDSTVRAVYIPVAHQGELQLDSAYVASHLKPFIESSKLGKIAQNCKYETNVLSTLGMRFGPVVFDPMLASYIVNPGDKHGLKDQSERILHHQMVRISELIGNGRKQITMDAVPVAKAAPYASDDARVTFELARYYCRHLDADQRFLLYQMELPLAAVLARMEQTGVALDSAYLSNFSQELSSELARLEKEIYELAGHAFNINSPSQLQTVLFEELKLPVKARARTKSGLYSTDASVLEALVSEHPIVCLILEYRQNAKLRSTYVDALPRQLCLRDGRLHGEFNQIGTSTGRLSSSNPNLQNIPIKTALGRRIRRAFIPGDKGSLLLAADYSQIELRLLAHMSGDETLLEAFRQGEDIHARTAMAIYDVPAEQITSDMRRVGKTINFSLIYQQGAYSTAQDLGISTREAQAFIDKYFQRYPKVRSFITKTIEEARRSGYARTLWGRRRYFRHLNDKNEAIRRADERAAANAPLQGSAADLMKLAMIRLDRQLNQQKLSARIILQVHDELVLEVPEMELEQTQEVLLSSMELDQPLAVPLKVDVGAGRTWMDV